MYRETMINRIRYGVKKILKDCALGRMVYEPVHQLYRAFAIPRRRARLQKYGFSVLKNLDELLTRNGIQYFCDAGTMLGLVRDSGFIKSDDDIDITIMPGQISGGELLQKLLDAGYGFVHAFEYEGKMIEFTVMDQRQIPIDFFLQEKYAEDPRYLVVYGLRWYPTEKYPTENANTGLRFLFLCPTGFRRQTIGGVEVSLPENVEEVLESQYGPWQHPDPNYHADEHLKFVRLPGFVYRLTKEEALAHK